MPWEGGRSAAFDAETSRVLSDRSRKEALARLKPLLQKTRLPASRRHLVAAEPISGIAAVARAIGSSIVVMGAISRSGLKRFFIGNTAEQILDAIQCDVLVVKHRGFVSPVGKHLRRTG
jgi:universal stress protein E